MKAVKLSLFLFSFIFIIPSFLTASVGGVSGSNIFTLTGGSNSSPSYKIVSAGSLGDPIFVGTVSSLSDSDKNITFSTGIDENNNTTYPFFAAGSFDPDVQIPILTATVSSNAVSSISVDYSRSADPLSTCFVD